MKQESFQAYFEENSPYYLQFLRQMVEINSFTENAEGVNKLGEVTADAFIPLGFEAEFITSHRAEYGRHVVLTRKGNGQHKIGMVSHLDTVFPPEEEIRNDFVWREEGSRIYGPGTVDIKGGTVLIYMMMAALKALEPTIFDEVTWIILLDASEEADAADFGQLCIKRLTGALAGLIFEGGFFNGEEFWAVTARKGMITAQVKAEGRASHAGTSHEQGANAIVQLAETVGQLAAITNYENDVTVNVGRIEGGTVTNRVPHEAQALLEMRAFKRDIFETAVSDILAVSERATIRSGNGAFPCTITTEVLRETPPWPRNEATDNLFAIWQAAGKELGYRVVMEERGGLSDGNHFWHAVPSLDGLGVAGANAHCSERSEDGSKEQEYCDVDSFVPKALLNVAGVLRLLQS